MIFNLQPALSEVLNGPDFGQGSLAVSDLNQIDTAVMNKVYTVLKRIHPNGNKPIESWLAKAPAEAIKLGEFETPKQFLQELAKDGTTKLQLPILYVTREPSIAYADPSMTGHTELAEADIIEDSEGKAVARIMTSVATFSYTVNIVGWLDADIAPLAVLFTMWLRDRKASKGLSVKNRILGCKIETTAKFSDGLVATAANTSVPFSEDRLRMLSVTVTVEADLLMAEMLTTQIMNYQFSTEVING
jgi:hypothetical protein